MEPRRFDQDSDRPRPHDGPAATGRAIVVEPHLRDRSKASARALRVQRSPEAKLDESVGLAHAIDLDVVSSGIVPLAEIRPATFVGKGKVEEIAALVKGDEAGIVVMDCALSPVQQRNLEKAWQAKVLDRTGLILEIFGRRAHTREGSLQVELAHLTYQKSRLVRSWTHLERQRGGFGFLGGPGESQLETDRRLIEERNARIENDLDKVKRTRKLHRDSRKRVPYPIVALVGYTNAGKSTLFNRLTRAAIRYGTRWRPARCSRRVACTFFNSFSSRTMRSPIMRRSASIWVSPGPPRKPKPPRCRSRWVQDRTSRLR